MLPFDISNLFMRLPFTETIDICTDIFYQCHMSATPIYETAFIKFMEFVMYKEI